METYLSPIGDNLLSQLSALASNSLGAKINVYKSGETFPDLSQVKIVILGVEEAYEESKPYLSLDSIRLAFYSLYEGNWKHQIADIGNILAGHKRSDTLFALQEVIQSLLKQDILPIILGGGQDLVYAQYKAYHYQNRMLNFVNVDHSFDLGDIEEPISPKSYVGKMVSEEPYRLFNYTVLGYQSYYNSADEIALMDTLMFDSYRIGELVSDITQVEPYVRNADFASIDLKSIQASFVGNIHSYPNGFDSREICALVRYIGLSNSCSSISFTELYDMHKSPQAASLMAQALWYFIEGVNFRVADEDFENEQYYKNYQVLIDDNTILQFKKSIKSSRWWIILPKSLEIDTKHYNIALLPCTYEEYVDACSQQIPERWLKTISKLGV